jgi:hypothetical protein
MTGRYVGLLLTACALVLPGCGDIAGEDTGRITVLLTDAPGDVVSAVVTIESIYIQGGTEEDGDEDDEGSRLYLRTDPVTTDLLTLRDDVATLVEGAALPEGRYGQLRFVLSGAYIEVEDEEGTSIFATAGYAEAPAQPDGTLQCPSCAQSGLKINLPAGFEVTEGEEQSVLVDFDVSQSFGKQAGNSGRWVMHPTITAARVN